MPYTIRKLPGKNCYRVTNTRTKRVMSKCATLENAKKQLKLLRAIEYNRDFVPRNSRKTRKTRK